MLIADTDMGNIIYTSLLISLVLLICITTFHNSFSLINTKSSFSESTAKIKSISSSTSDGKYFINLQYGPEVKKGEPMFFMANLFDNTGDKQIRMRHVDCDFIILKDGIELVKMSTKYGEPLFHSINGVMLPSFRFGESGNYTISVEIAAQFFIPITPVFGNFSAAVSPTADGNLIKLST
ncbi:MAG: hypothetical protein E6L03_03175 [Thaumarchaeota archaeon]|nr:MAG: hypothetical protein E6L03_03175 [Nitrososphaerota archaeon]